MEETRFTIEPIVDNATNSIIYTNRDIKEQLLQYNLSDTLRIHKFRFVGQFVSQSTSDYQELLNSLFSNLSILNVLGCSGEPNIPINIKTEALSMATMSMSFFDRLSERGK
jgi:hypothetical protein